VMAVTANDRSAGCTQDITGTIGTPATTGNGYRIRTRIAYIVNATVNTAGCDATRVLSTTVFTLNTPLTIIIDAYVDYRDPDNIAQWRTVHRRTVQKI